MFKKHTIRKKLIISILIGILIPFLLGGLYLESAVTNWLYMNNFRVNEMILEQVNEFIDYSLVSNIEEKVEMLSKEDVVRKSIGKLNSYTNFESDSYKYVETANENKIEEYFEIIKKSNSSINFIFYGTEDGEYIEYPIFNPSKNYDPRLRPWYKETINTNEFIISDPYITNMTDELVISMMKTVKNGNEKIGVIGASVRIDEVTKSIEKIRIGNSGYLLIMNDRDKIVISPEKPGWLLKTPSELNIEALVNLEDNDDVFIEKNINGIDSIINVVVSEKNGWKIISVIEKAELLKKSKEVISFFALIYFITIIIIMIIVYIISSRMTKPILYISNAISEMAQFRFVLKDKEIIDTYSKKEDEIGIMSRALVEMNTNFVELMDQVDVLNGEIRNIDIENKPNQGVYLSENNPFFSVVDSMNILLEKVNIYFEKLKKSNVEIVNKNELLIATEEELRAQINEIDSQKKYINYLAFHDPLTELANRRKFVEHFNNRKTNDYYCAVVLLDLDNFKGINDTMGHIYGDRVLKKVAERLSILVSENIFISRFGGDEFLILIESDDGTEDFEYSIEKLAHLFDQDIEVDGNLIDIKYSMGISLYPENSDNIDKLIMYSDLALYSVKNTSKNNYKFFDDVMMKSLLKKSEIESVLREAIDSDGFKLVYQPIIDTSTNRADSYEALLRLKNHNISPGDFIPVAEEIGLISKIGRIVAEKVIRQLAEWKEQGSDLKPIAINFSAIQLHDSTYLEYLKSLFTEFNINPKLIEIEITENVFLDNKELAINYFTEFRKLGMAISIDDFGTGYSSISYLMLLPVDKIKLDRSLNLKFLELDNIKVLDGLIALIHGLKLKVVAEGIEEFEQVRRLKVGKCDYIQGYYFSRPMEAIDVPKSMDCEYL